MATSEQKVKEVHPRASKKRYSTHGGGGYYLIWSGFPEGRESVRLGEGKTASAAWVDAAKNIRRVAEQSSSAVQESSNGQ
jgi:hypothetical protein